MSQRAFSLLTASAVMLVSFLSAPAAQAAPVTTAGMLPDLLVTAAPATSPAYDRSLFAHWSDADGDGCNTRYEVLIEESTTPVAVAPGCRLSGGTWVSPYDGFATTDLSQIQIDHVVALAEAWRSGAWAWSPAQREAFANDLGVTYALTAASNTANQSKADKDPGAWMPSNASYWCEYATSWALVKYRWSLTVDARESAALRSVLSGDCGNTPVTLPAVQVTQPAGPELSDPAPETSVPQFPSGMTRLAGQSRYETAIAVSQRYAAGVPAVFIATGTNFPDALAAAAAAAKLGGPLLLTPSDTLPAAVLAEIRRLRPEHIYIAGDHGVVSRGIEAALQREATTSRLGGLSRYETANSIVGTVFPQASHAFIATGRTFPDALAATGAAGSLTAPVILVDGALSTLRPSTLELLNRLQVRSVTIAGGPGAVSAGIESQLSRTFSTARIGGSSRYETAASINDAYFNPGSPPAAFLATGTNFPDALAGAALAGLLKSPVYITTTPCVPESSHLSLARMGVRSTVALGTANVVSDAAAANLGCLTAGRPTISGAPRIGSTLTVSPGAWTAGTAFSYQWLAGGAFIAGATGSALTITSGLAGKQISVRVTGSLSGHATATALSAATSKVTYPGTTTPVDSWSCPSWAPIKGNIGASGKIYHLPSGAFYSRTNPEECFRTEADARSAGYRKSQR